MSWCLIKKGLELIDEDFGSKPDSDLKTLKPKETKQHGLRSLKKQKLNQQLKKKVAATNFSQRKVKNALQFYEKRNVKDQTSENVKYLQKIDAKLNLNTNLDKVKEHHTTKLYKENETLHTKSLEKSKKARKTIFTDDDFEKMNNEWLSLM